MYHHVTRHYILCVTFHFWCLFKKRNLAQEVISWDIISWNIVKLRFIRSWVVLVYFTLEKIGQIILEVCTFLFVVHMNHIPKVQRYELTWSVTYADLSVRKLNIEDYAKYVIWLNYLIFRVLISIYRKLSTIILFIYWTPWAASLCCCWCA